MNKALDDEFDRADQILSSAIQDFQSQNISQYVWGMALVEVGVSALIKLDEDENALIESVKEFARKAKQLSI